jgi:hypothetical protein
MGWRRTRNRGNNSNNGNYVYLFCYLAILSLVSCISREDKQVFLSVAVGSSPTVFLFCVFKNINFAVINILNDIGAEGRFR